MKEIDNERFSQILLDLNKKLKMNENKESNIVCIDGVVGVGKTTLCEYLVEEINDLNFFKEPVINNPLLEDFYKDQERWSFALQIFFLNRRFEMIKEAMKRKNCVMDRSIYGDVIFAKMLYDDGKMSRNEFNTYIELFNNMIQHVSAPKLMVYLKTDVDDAVRKINKRNRSYEIGVPIEYWQSLNENYEEYFKNYKDYGISKLMVVDVHKRDFVEDEGFRKELISMIKENI